MSSPVPPPRFDLVDVPEVGAILARAQEDLAGAVARLARYREHGPDEHGAALDALAALPDLDPALEDLSAGDTDREARLLRAARTVRAAWETRGTGPGDTVGAERFATVFDLFGRAEQDLLVLCAQDPTDVTAWTLRLSSARGLALGAGESRRRWARLTAVETHSVRAQREFLQHLTPKWGGSWEAVEDHVRTVTAAAAPGSAEWSIVPYAALTRWYDERGADTTPLCDPEVVAAVEAAAEQFLAAPCPSRVGARIAHTDFAVALGLAGRRGRSAAHFGRLGPSLDTEAWALGAEHRTDLENIRASALAEGRRR